MNITRVGNETTGFSHMLNDTSRVTNNNNHHARPTRSYCSQLRQLHDGGGAIKDQAQRYLLALVSNFLFISRYPSRIKREIEAVKRENSSQP